MGHWLPSERLNTRLAVTMEPCIPICRAAVGAHEQTSARHSSAHVARRSGKWPITRYIALQMVLLGCATEEPSPPKVPIEAGLVDAVAQAPASPDASAEAASSDTDLDASEPEQS